MERVISKVKQIDQSFINYFRPRSVDLLRISIGVIYFLFGILKFFPQYSPAEQLASETISKMTLGWISGANALIALALIEVGIGVGLVVGQQLKVIIWIALWHMGCTFFPMLFMPEAAYSITPISLSLVGQYILKNIIIIFALLTIYTSNQKMTS